MFAPDLGPFLLIIVALFLYGPFMTTLVLKRVFIEEGMSKKKRRNFYILCPVITILAALLLFNLFA